MHWYRRPHNDSRHVRYDKLARITGLPRYLLIAAYDALREHASQQKDRGSVVGMDAETMALTIGCEEEEAKRFINACVHKEMIVQPEPGRWRLADWEEEQTADPSAADRMRRLRAKKGSVTQRNVTRTHRNGPNKPGNGFSTSDDALVPAAGDVMEIQKEDKGLGDASVTQRNALRPLRKREERDKKEKKEKDTPPSPLGTAPPGGGSGPERKACRLPRDFVPDRAFAEGKGFPAGEAEELEANFRDYWNAKKRDAEKLDWQATWRVWVRTEASKRRKPAPVIGRKPALDAKGLPVGDLRAREAAIMARREAKENASVH